MLTNDENNSKLGDMSRFRVFTIECLRCGHEWVPRKRDGDIRICPRCKSYLFDRPRKTPPPENK